MLVFLRNGKYEFYNVKIMVLEHVRCLLHGEILVVKVENYNQCSILTFIKILNHRNYQ
jgi:hypothetical protein